MSDNLNEPEEEIDIMSSLQQRKMFAIHKEFEKNPQGLEMHKFVEVMLNNLDYEKSKKLDISLAVIELFKDIDVNGDGTLEWNEFSNHIIELGLVRKDKTFKNVIKSYYPSQTLTDNEKHENEIEKVYYFGDKLKSLLVLEKDSSKFKVYNANDGKMSVQVKAHKSPILSAEYIPELQLVATSSNDLTVNFWETQNYQLKQVISVPEIQLCMKYANWGNNCQLLYLGGSDATIRYYDVNTFKERGNISAWNPFFKKDILQQGHSGPIAGIIYIKQDILPVYSQQTLVSAGLDGKICLWDFPTHSFKKELQGHDKGVYSVDWSEWSQMNNCLISAGFDHDAYVWNTYVREKIFLLRGHNHPLVGVKCLPNSPQVVTADIKGMVKIWDVRNFMCMQTFNVPVEEVSSFCMTYPKKRVVVAERYLHFYDYDEPKDQLLTDETVCLRVIYSKDTFQFITLHPTGVKIWNDKGELIRVYRQITKNDLTCCTVDKRQLKLFVGTSEGKIFTINLKNGHKMKKFQKHKSMVTDLFYWKSIGDDKESQIKRIISASRDNYVNIHDEDCQLSQSIRSQIKQHNSHVNCLGIEGDQLASCADDGSLILTNLQTGRNDFLRHHQSELKKVLFLQPHKCLVATDANGQVLFFTTHNQTSKEKMILKRTYRTNSLTNKKLDAPVQALAFFISLKQLIVADEFGYVQIWDLDQLLAKNNRLNKSQNNKIPQNNRSKNTFMTDNDDISQDQYSNFFSNDDVIELKTLKCHNDAITSIACLQYETAFATSSFDCCVHIWSLTNYNKLGSLILAQSNNLWQLKIDKKHNEQTNLKFAKEILKTINQSDDNEEKDNESQDISTSRSKKNILKTARSLISQCKQLKENNWEPDELENQERGDNDDDQYNDHDILNELNHVTGVQPSNPVISRK